MLLLLLVTACHAPKVIAIAVGDGAIVSLKDAEGLPVAGAHVTFAMTAVDGSRETLFMRTDARGLARAPLASKLASVYAEAGTLSVSLDTMSVVSYERITGVPALAVARD